MKVINSLSLVFLSFILIRDTLLINLITKSNEISQCFHNISMQFCALITRYDSVIPLWKKY